MGRAYVGRTKVGRWWTDLKRDVELDAQVDIHKGEAAVTLTPYESMLCHPVATTKSYYIAYHNQCYTA